MDTAFLRDLLISLKQELVRYKSYVVGLFVAVSFVVLGIGLVWPSTYTTSALLYVDATTIIEPLLRGRAEVTEIDRTQKAIEMVGTRKIMEEAARRLGLFEEDDPPQVKESVILQLLGRIEVRDERNNHFRIKFYSSDPFFSYQGINTVVDVLIEESIRQKEQESRSAFSFIDQQVALYKSQLEAADEKLKEFKSNNIDGTEQSVNNKINQLRTDIENLALSIEEARETIVTTKQQLSQEEQYQEARGQLEIYKNRRQALVEELDQLRLVFQESYPDIVSVKAQIEELDDAIVKQQLSTGGLYGSDNDQLENPLHEDLRRRLRITEVELKTQLRRKTSLDNLLEKEYQRAEKIVSNQAELAELNRDYNVTRDVYEEMLQRKESARLSVTIDEQGQGVSYKVREPAVFPLKPSGIQFIHFAILGPMMAFCMPIGLVIAYIMVDPRIRSPLMLQQTLPKEYELLGTVPHFSTPLAERVLKKDVIFLGVIGLVSLLVYIAIAALRITGVI